MYSRLRTILMPALAAALLLASCGQAPGVAVESSAPASTAAGGLTEADAEATVEARVAEALASAAPGAAGNFTEADVEATVQARLAEAQSSASPSAGGGFTEAEAEATIEARLAEAQASAQALGSAAAASAAPSVAAAPSTQASPSVEASAEASPSVEASTAAAAQVPATGDDQLLMAGRSNIFSQLQGDSWSTFQAEGNSCLNDDNTALFDTDGTPIISCGGRLYKSTAAGQWEKFDDDHYGTPHLGPDGKLWIVAGETVWAREGEQWTTYEAADTVRAEDFPTRDMAFSPDGTVYFGGIGNQDDQLASFDGTSWRNYGNVLDAFIYSLLYSSKGELLVGGGDGTLYRLNGDALEPVVTAEQIGELMGTRIDYGGKIREIAETPDGTIWMATDSGLVSWSGDELKLEEPTEGPPAFSINDLAVDEGGNLWVATVHGIAVRRGGAWQAAVPATSGLGESYIWTIATRGTPQLPPDTAPKTASLSGRITLDNAAMVNRPIQLCNERLPFSRIFGQRRDGACASQKTILEASTDGEGNYRFDNVPIGNYAVAFQNEDELWLVTGYEVNLLTPGQEYRLDVPLK